MDASENLRIRLLTSLKSFNIYIFDDQNIFLQNEYIFQKDFYLYLYHIDFFLQIIYLAKKTILFPQKNFPQFGVTADQAVK